jgi:hypothetical protein
MPLYIMNIKLKRLKQTLKIFEHQTESKLSFERSLVNLTRLKLSPDQRRRGGAKAYRIWSFLFRSRLVWPSICLQRWVPTTPLTTTQTPYKVLFEYRIYTHYLFCSYTGIELTFLARR